MRSISQSRRPADILSHILYDKIENICLKTGKIQKLITQVYRNSLAHRKYYGYKEPRELPG